MQLLMLKDDSATGATQAAGDDSGQRTVEGTKSLRCVPLRQALAPAGAADALKVVQLGHGPFASAHHVFLTDVPATSQHSSAPARVKAQSVAAGAGLTRSAYGDGRMNTVVAMAVYGPGKKTQRCQFEISTFKPHSDAEKGSGSRLAPKSTSAPVSVTPPIAQPRTWPASEPGSTLRLPIAPPACVDTTERKREPRPAGTQKNGADVLGWPLALIMQPLSNKAPQN